MSKQKRLTSRSGKRAILTWLELDVLRKLKAEAAAKGVSQQRIVESLVLERYSVELKEDRDALFIRRLNALDARLKVLEGQGEIQAEAFALFVRMWLTNTLEVSEDQREAAIAQAQARYKRFLEKVSRRIEAGRGFFSELPRQKTLKASDFTE